MRKTTINKISVYIPDEKVGEGIVPRLLAVGAKRDRSVNYLVLQAIEQFLERAERKR